MKTYLPLLAAALAACAPQTPGEGAFDVAALDQASLAGGGFVVDLDREPLAGGLAHYRIELRVGDTANAALRLHRVVRERAPWWPRRAPHAVMLLHGDFSTFDSNFALPSAPGGGLALHLAGRGIDVWGFDRRWTQAPADAPDLSDFADMGFAQALDDTRSALAFARALRALTGSGWDRMALGGFSRGAHLTYAYASVESALPPGHRHVDGIVPIDVYATIAPEHDEVRLAACARRDGDRALLEAGEVHSDNTVLPVIAALASSAPDEASPVFPGYTNRDVLLAFGALTFSFFDATPVYHLAGGELGELGPVGLRYTDEAVLGDWFAAAAPHQALAEIADGDTLWCGEGPLPPGADLTGIEVPALHVGAAGGFGDYALHTVDQLASTDVTTLIIRRLAPERELEDYGHADLLFATDAPGAVWEPMADWLLSH